VIGVGGVAVRLAAVVAGSGDLLDVAAASSTLTVAATASVNTLGRVLGTVAMPPGAIAHVLVAPGEPGVSGSALLTGGLRRPSF
jgi:hypothetical protein